MLRALFLALTFAAAQMRDAPPPLTLEIRAFDGPDEVTAETRVTVQRAGARTDPVAQGAGRLGHLEMPVPPGIYDVQAIRETNGRVSSIRWAERLVVMAYPDEAGRHLEVVNFKSGFGALQIRSKQSTATPDVAIYVAAAHDKEAARRFDGPGYGLFVVAAGRYDIQERMDGRQVWHTDIDVPLDGTRLWIVPDRRLQLRLRPATKRPWPVFVEARRQPSGWLVGPESAIRKRTHLRPDGLRRASKRTNGQTNKRRSGRPFFFSGLLDPLTREQAKHDHHERNHEQQMNQPARHVQRETENPQNQQQNNDRPQHTERPPAVTRAAGYCRASGVPHR